MNEKLIKQLQEGKIAVKNDGTLEGLTSGFTKLFDDNRLGMLHAMAFDIQKLPDTIDVVIPAQKFYAEKYISGTDCYLAEALKKLGWRKVKVSGLGHFTIDGVDYVTSPETPFNCGICRDMFNEGRDINLKLVKVV